MHKNNSPDETMNGRMWKGRKKTDKEIFAGVVSRYIKKITELDRCFYAKIYWLMDQTSWTIDPKEAYLRG